MTLVIILALWLALAHLLTPGITERNYWAGALAFDINKLDGYASNRNHRKNHPIPRSCPEAEGRRARNPSPKEESVPDLARCDKNLPTFLAFPTDRNPIA
jgi:hypothetical protein